MRERPIVGRKNLSMEGYKMRKQTKTAEFLEVLASLAVVVAMVSGWAL